MAQKLKKLSLNRVDLVDRGANPAAHITLFKAASMAECPHGLAPNKCPDCKTKTNQGDDPMPEITKADIDTAVAKALADAKTAADAAVAKAVADATAAAKADTDAAIAKAAKDAKDAADAEIKKAHDALAVEKAVRVRKEFTDKVRLFKCLPLRVEAEGDKKSDVDTLMALAEKAPEEFKRVEEILQAADAALVKGASFAEVGKSGPGKIAAGSAQEEIEKRAGELVKADKTMTKEVAIGKVLEADPALYTKHVEEQRAAARR